MKHILIYIGLVLLFVSCVSKKKYAALKQQHEQTLTDKVTLEDVLGKITVENDSLKKQITLLDSLLRTANIKNNMVPNVSPVMDVATKTRANSTISKKAEYDTKALYIYGITHYVFWPSSVKTDKFLIGIIGESKLNAALAAQMYGKKAHGLPAIIEPYAPASGKFYHMIFIAESKQNDFSKIKKELKDQPVLLIVENQYLEKAGAHVSIFADGDKIKFKVNKKLIEKAGMNVSEALIKLGETTQ